MSVHVKICGICRVEDARASVDAGADYLGVNFWAGSPRHVDVATAARIAAAVPGVPLVGVFVNAPRAEVANVAREAGLALVQFHGDEDPAYCEGWDWPTIKALRPAPGEDAAGLAALYRTDFVMLDAYVPGRRGGTGVPLDPVVATGVPPARLFLAGGLRPETVAEVVRRVRPYAVDVASGVEAHAREKDHAKLEAFIRSAKAA